MIYYGCKYFPVLAAEAMGSKCEMINSAAEDFDRSDEIAHQNLCGYSKAMIDFVLENKVSELVLTNCCDCIRRAYDVLSEYGKMDYLYLIDLPHDDTSCAKEYFAGEILKFIDSYEKYKGVEFDLNKMEINSMEEPCEEDHILLTGARVSEELLGEIRDISRLPVVNRTCSGMLPYGGCLPELEGREDFAKWYADILLSQDGCMRMNDISLRRTGISDPRVKGIVYHSIKFCDFYPYEYAKIKDGTHVPVTKIETDFTKQSNGQILTRVEGLMESVSDSTGQKREVNEDGRYVIGIDSGSTSTNAAVLDMHGKMVAGVIVPTGAKITGSAGRAVNEAMKEAGITDSEVYNTVATGYGRNGIVTDGETVTEISCHAKGAFWLDKRTRTIIDIGGQDNKIISIDENGNVRNFVMNDKCAAGTGRFLDNMARVLETDIDEMSRKGLKWKEDLTISSMCTVFAESEVVSLIADNKTENDIIHGLNKSVASKIASLARRMTVDERVMITGGVAQNAGVVKAIEDQLHVKLLVPEQAQLAGAIGAALFAAERREI
ncbi:MAG: acyl-CoA dehydratase activase [Eubacteriaceae bacterium]|nr:acyl-CoA dehydratase activase [Eubacteriaceae bacterium]